jgi:hypothetical protein
MITDSEQATTWHLPTPGGGSALGVIVPVGPSHDPVASIVCSDHAAVTGGMPVVHLVVVNGDGADARAPGLLCRLSGLKDRIALVSIGGPVGYVRAVRHGLGVADKLGLRGDRIGFLDADADLRAAMHWRETAAALDSEPDLDAISGLVVHADCRIWETLSSARFVAALERAVGGPIHKPYLQGGAGGTLARRAEFSQAVDDALQMGTLIGPTLSATSIAAGRRVVATSLLPCGHTPRRTMQEWTDSVTAYERSWRGLIDLFGNDIEKPWQEFLELAERALAGQPKLLVDLRYNTAMRQHIVAGVEAERRRLKAAGAR